MIALHLRFKIGMQQIRFFLVELEDRVAVFEGDEILVAVEQAQAVDGLFVAVAIVVAHFELLARLVFLAQAHQVDAQLRARRPEPRVGFDRLAVVGDAVLVAAVQNQMMRNERVAFAVGGIDLANFFQPRIGRAVGEHFDGRMNRHGVQRFGRNFQRLVGFVEGLCFGRNLRAAGWPSVRALRTSFGSSSIALLAYSIALLSKPSALTSARP